MLSAEIFAALVSMELATATTLLLFIFLSSTLSALEAPAWQSIVPQLVPKEDLQPALAVNSAGVNLSRAVGPALAGITIAWFSIAAPFWIDAFSNIGVIGILLWWRMSLGQSHTLPPERFGNAIRTGVRYVRNNRHLRATLMRGVAFFLFASAYWALLPLVTRDQIEGGPELYGGLLGAIGIGAIGCAFVLPRLKAKIDPNGLVTIGQIGTAIALILFALAREPIMAVSASLIAGMSWITVLASLNVSAQVSLPDWVRGRGLALYVMTFFGAMTAGSVLWGEIAGIAGLAGAHAIAAAGALLTIVLTKRWRLQTAAGIDLTPSMHWPEPIVSEAVVNDAGPVMVSIEYRIHPKDRDLFLAALEELARERKRDGAYSWGVFQDAAVEERFLETFLLNSWLEHLRQHERVTNADRVLEGRVHRFLTAKPQVTHLIAAKRDRGTRNAR